MHVISLINRLALFCITIICCCACASQKTPSEEISYFAKQLISIVKNKESNELAKIGCFPAACLDSEAIEYILGTNLEKSYILNLLEIERVRFKQFGPFTYQDNLPDMSYVIMFYDPEKVHFDANGFLSESERERLWWNGYVETVVTVKNNKVLFHRTPFYYGANLPFVEDY